MKMDLKQQFSNFLIVFLFLISLSTANGDCYIPTPSAGVDITVPGWVPGKHRILPENAIINYKCIAGYNRMLGDTSALCSQGRLRLLSSIKRAKALKCARKKCIVPDIENGKKQIASTEAFFQCDRGYFMNGSATIQCKLIGDEYRLVADPPTCEPLSKCPAPIVANSQIRNPCCFQGDVVEIQCNDNYEIIGNQFLECLASGYWNDTLPECNYIPNCKDPGILLHGNFTGSCCREGSILKFQCDEGFEFENSRQANKIECLHTERWSASRPKCKPKGSSTCEMPNLDDRNLEIIYEKHIPSDYKLEVYLSGSEVEFQCKEDYDNDSDEMYLYCDEGNWDIHVPFCYPKKPCKRPSEPLNGKITELKSDDSEEFPVGFEINFECYEGYIIKNTEYASVCLGNNKWQGGDIPNCTKITCTPLAKLENGYVNGDSFYFGDQLKFSCYNGYELLGSETRTCQLNGQWSGKLAICNKGDTYCPNPGVPINGYRKGDSFDLDDEITFSCKRGFFLIGNATRICLEQHIWSGEEVFCKGALEFTKIEDARDLLEETMALAARRTASSDLMKNMGRALVNLNDVNGVNIIFIFDGSGSINKQGFKRAQLFAEALIRKVGVSFENGGTKIAAILFSSEAQDIIKGTDVETINQALQKIKEMVPPKKGTNIYKALKSAAHLSNLARAYRTHSKTVAFLFTDGNANEGGDPEIKAKELIENHQIELFCITIGRNINDELLQRLVKNDNKHIIHLANYNELFQVISHIADEETNYARCGLGSSSYVSPNHDLGRIIGGKKVIKSWPWMTSLKYKNKHKCGGSIIHNRWVLTAAHCFEKYRYELANWKAHVGMVEEKHRDKAPFDHYFEVPIEEIILHERSDFQTFAFDIALVKLAMPLSFDMFMRPICLPPKFTDLSQETKLYKEGEEATVVGWGNTDQITPETSNHDLKFVDHARHVLLPLQSKETCGHTVEWKECEEDRCSPVKMKVTETMICAGRADGKQDSCKGDSGGPMMQNSLSAIGNYTDYRWFEVGIVSWGMGCALEGYYGYYTNVAKLRDWIDTTTGVTFENVIPVPKEVP